MAILLENHVYTENLRPASDGAKRCGPNAVRYPCDRIGLGSVPCGMGRKGVPVGKINVDYPGLLKLFPEYLNPKRSESASFLIWYLENYYRLDGLEAVDSVCDKRGDKGVDGIFVNDNDKTIYGASVKNQSE